MTLTTTDIHPLYLRALAGDADALPPCPMCGLTPDRFGWLTHGVFCCFELTTGTPEAWLHHAETIAAGLRALGRPVHSNYEQWERDHAL